MTATQTTALLFPGQGSQTPHMRDLVETHRPDLLDAAEALVGSDLFDRVEESTRFAQPAIFCASLASYEALGRPEAAALAGHSLGEISALAAAGALHDEDALWLVVVRGAAMAEVGNDAGGGMLALLKGRPGQAEQLADGFGLTVANDNAPGQVVLAGSDDALAEVAAAARADGLRAMRLDVAGAFHSPAMRSAASAFKDALEQVAVAEPSSPVYSSASAARFQDVRAELMRAVTRPVRWRETMLALAAAGVHRFVDVGPGAVLAKLVARNVPDAETVVAQEALDVRA